MISFLVVFICGSYLSQMLSNSGAFEIYYEGNKIFSKIEAGRMPFTDEIIEGIKYFNK